METIDEKFYSQNLKYSILFKTITILTNFMHKGQMESTFEITGKQMPNPFNPLWDEGF